MPSARRFPPPWTIEENNDACFIVKDATGQALGYFYFEDEPGRRSTDVRFKATAVIGCVSSETARSQMTLMRHWWRGEGFLRELPVWSQNAAKRMLAAGMAGGTDRVYCPVEDECGAGRRLSRPVPNL
jgi:hypothetical protein